MFQDLALNILAEILGIVVTVFWLDRLFNKREKEREEKRWEPSKMFIYAKLHMPMLLSHSESAWRKRLTFTSGWEKKVTKNLKKSKTLKLLEMKGEEMMFKNRMRV